MEGALERDGVIAILQQNAVPLYIGNGANSQAERKPESEKQPSEKLHPDRRGWETRLEGSGVREKGVDCGDI